MHVTSAASAANADHQEHFASRIVGLPRPGPSGWRYLGLAFKAGTDDTRSSPSLRVAQILMERGPEVVGFDPHCRRQRGLGPSRACASPIPRRRRFEGAGVAVIGTEWPSCFRELDWKSLAARMSAPVVIDGRRLLDGPTMRALGSSYEAVGAPGSARLSQIPDVDRVGGAAGQKPA